MKVIDDKNAQATSSKTVTTVANVVPTSNFNISSLIGYTVNLTSTSSDTDGTIVSYKWNWGDSSSNDTIASPTHTFTQAGTYTVSLTVVDNDGASSTIKTSTVTVPTVLPVSSFTATVNKMSVSFDGSASTDQFGSITSYVWTFGDGSTLTTTIPTISRTYTTVGTFTVSMKVIDDKNAQATSSKTVTTVANSAPIASFNIASSSGYLVNVVSTSTDSDGTIAVYQWNWGDGTSNDTGASASHTYNQIGTFEIKLSVKDNNGDWSSI
jgi:PKD repeat protein